MKEQALDKKNSDSIPAAGIARGILQRKCDCGTHTIGGSQCDGCSQKRLQRRAANHTGAAKASSVIDSKRNASIRPRETAQAFAHDFSGVPAHAAHHAAQTPTAPRNTFEDCPADWQTKANAALARGRPWVANVITGLSMLPTPIPPRVAALLTRHFHTTSANHIREIIGHFRTIYNAMNASIDFECETDCDAGVAAYVYTVWTDLHLCPVWYGLSANGQTNTIIHEIAHDAANRDDEAYVWQPSYATLSAADAIDNADSYSNFAEEAMTP